MKHILILGYGFTGKALAGFLSGKGYRVSISSRNPGRFNHLNYTAIEFDINNETTFTNIPAGTDIIWTFPAQPLQLVEKLYHNLKKDAKVRVVFATTSSYLQKSGIIDENSPLDLSLERVKGENFLKEHGSTVLQLSGIHGNERNPFNWLNKGLIKNANKYVNLIHIDDICNSVLKVIETDFYGERVNLSDGKSYLWKNIWQFGKDNNLTTAECPPELDDDKRIISNDKLQRLLGGNYRFNYLL